MTQRKGRTLREVENWLLAHKDWLSSDLPGWLLKLVSGSEYETGLLDLALRRLYLEKHSEEGVREPTRTPTICCRPCTVIFRGCGRLWNLRR